MRSALFFAPASAFKAWYYTRGISGHKLYRNININTPAILQRSEHQISRANISESALKVLYRLKNAGYEAYLVGGGVRDLLLGREPKDFDISTDATPEQVKGLFRNCRLVGRRFRLAHVRFRDEVIEVSTFRGSPSADVEDDEMSADGRILRDNVYGTLEEDAFRRDFTVNALYYNINDFSVVDYTRGVEDLNRGLLQLIGDPAERYREDPVRMLRAVRFAVKLGFRLEEKTEQSIYELGYLLSDIPAARLFEEALKLFHAGYALQSFEQLRHFKLFQYLFPQTESSLAIEEGGFPAIFVARALANTDQRISEGKSVTPAFLFAAILWDPVKKRAAELVAAGASEIEALLEAGSQMIANQNKAITIPRRFSMAMREIWTMQPRFKARQGRRAQRLYHHPRFRAAYDFLVLRAESGEDVTDLAEWWTQFQEKDVGEQDQQLKSAPRKRRRRRKPAQSSENNPAGG